MRKLPLIATFATFLTLPLFAQVERPRLVLSATMTNPAPHHGEQVRLEVTVRNAGPGDIRNLSYNVELDGATFLGAIAEFHCSGAELASNVRCGVPSLEENTNVQHAFELRMSNSAAMYRAEGAIFTYTYGSSALEQATDELSFDLQGPISAAPSLSDVVVSQAFSPDPVALDSTVRLSTTVTNLGPDAAHDLAVAIDLPFLGSATALSGADCHFDERHFVCGNFGLLAGERREIFVDFATLGVPSSNVIRSYVTFADGTDPNGANNSSERGFHVGLADVGTVMLPLVVPKTGGVGGTRWVTETSAFLDGDTSAFLFPLSNSCPVPCPVIATKMLEPRLVAELQIPSSPDFPGYLLRYDRRRGDDLSFIHRVRETSRVNDSWGVDLPIVFEEDFLRGPIQILGVAGFDRYRRMLRIYQPDARPSTVTVRVYDGAFEEELAVEIRVVLRQPDTAFRFNGLPIRASYAQLSLDQIYQGIDDVRSVRVEIVPDSEDLRHWAFVSITDNITHEVRLAVPHQRPRSWSPVD
ncbi:MAG: DUF11 domain-containing protein [Acidobacteria bacterium]|nr:DUF11 domain-containing protein [Acidobacteriota bacterium]